jgi:hypothetical protein
MRTDTFAKISSHNHTGSGNGLQLTAGAFADDALTFAKINGANNEYLTARNQADSGDKDILKINTSDEVEFGTTVGVITVQDDGFTILDNADNTKIIAFQASSITTGTTRTLTVPDADLIIVGTTTTQTLTNKTLTTPVIASISNSGTITVPTGTDTLVARDTTDTLTNKTLTSPTINTPVISSPSTFDVSDAVFSIQDNADATKEVRFQASGITTGTIRTLTVQDSDDTIVGRATTDTLTNKSIDSDNNTITNIVNADIKAAAAIDASKIADGTVSSAEFQYINSLSSNAQDQIDSKLPTTLTTTGDVIYSSGGSTAARLGIGSAGQVLAVSGGVPAWTTNTASPVAPTSKTTTYTALTTDDTILVDTSGGAWTLTLYPASGNAGRRLRVKKTTSDTASLTIDGNASETIDGVTTLIIDVQYESATLLCDGSNWFIEDHIIPFIGARVKTSGTTASSTSTPIDYASEDFDTHSAWAVTATGYQTTSGNTDVQIYKGGVSETCVGNWDTTRTSSGATVISLAKSDTIDIRLINTKTAPSDGDNCHLEITFLGK